MNVLEQNIGDFRRFLTAKHHAHACSYKFLKLKLNVYHYINKNKNGTRTDLRSNVYFKRCQYFRKFAKLC